MRHSARRPSTHVSSWAPRIALLGSGLAALVLAGVLLAAADGPGGGGGLLGRGGDTPEPRPAPAGGATPGPSGSPEEDVGREGGGPQRALVAGPAPVDPPPSGGVAAAGARRWAADLLRSWDRARERAWRAADPTALAALYVAGSTAGERDAALLQRWRSAGVEVRSLRLRVDALEVVALGPRRAVLEVTDRLRLDAVAEEVPGLLRLGRDRPSTRVVDLRRDDGTWRVAAVVPAGTA